MRMLPRALAVVFLFAPLSASAQFMDAVGGLFENVNSIVFYTQVGALTDNTTVEGTVADFGVVGLGTEVLIDLPSFGGSEFELSLGTNYVRGFEAVEPTLDLHASLRTLPQVAVYAAFVGISDEAVIQPYAGVSFGFSELWNARGYDAAGNTYDLSADTYELGAIGGLYVNKGLKGLYVEAGYRIRNFESLNWNAETIPPGWPRSIDTSSFIVNVGWQFRIRGDEEEE